MANDTYDIVIVGAGLAGLRAAQVARGVGARTLIIDKNDRVGGRARSRSIDGYIIDEGFQLINPGYPELIASGIVDDMKLKHFGGGLRIVEAHHERFWRDPRRAPVRAAIDWLRHGHRHDLWHLGMVMAGIAAESEPVRWFGDDMTTRQALTERNVSRKLQDELLAPFLDGVVLGDSMSESWRYVSLLLRSFTRGRPATTNSGIQGLADTLLAAGGAEVQLSTTVHAVKPDRVETDHGTFHASAVINATDGEDAAWLLGGGRPEWSAQTTYWFSAPRVRKGSLFAVSNAQSPRMGFLDLASVAPGRAPKKKSLIAVSTTGSGERVSEEMARREAARVYNILKSELHLIERTLVTRAVPRIRIPLRFTQATMRNGVYLAGDYLQTPSIQGAMVSGRRAAYAALYDLAKAEQALA